ncbi:MAG: hypothetical protein NTX50_22130 [Candidatus Sumerlaeota bacterium]|nr:hypothetical protein [Candidatus Sumerlaeota bacterium]
MKKKSKEILTVTRLAQMKGTTPRNVQKAAQAGEISVLAVVGRTIVLSDDALKWMPRPKGRPPKKK